HWRSEIRHYSGLENFFDRVETVYAFDRAIPLGVSKDDVFIATTWWTAHIAHKAAMDLNAGRFIYLIQEYEPFTFPLGTFYALAQETYSFPHFAVFSTELLREYFRRNRIGVFADGPESGEENSVSFENAIQSFDLSESEMRTRTKKKLLFYARPEQHASRNMFELGILALSRVIVEGHLNTDEWELYGIGSVGQAESIRVCDDVCMKLLPRVRLKEYAELLPQFDLGLSLMLTPHPSLLPIEMAGAGMIVVTNTFANKTAERMKTISSNIIAGEPTVEGVRLGLIAALEKVHDFKGRLEGSRVRWSNDWSKSFNDEIMSKIECFIRTRTCGRA
ncbi:MAG TPA: hypothetical protein VJ044_04300, partial [Candidatus Hodarchaeales archaeon]|nr:hypothetical protein [Candidatus Hodarchaeales archaeon]